MALVEQPEWCIDMFNHHLDLNLALLDMVWDAGYTFNSVKWPDDMGYKHNQFFSLSMYRELLKPVHKRAIDWAHAKGIKAHLHSWGDINPFVPEMKQRGGYIFSSDHSVASGVSLEDFRGIVELAKKLRSYK